MSKRRRKRKEVESGSSNWMTTYSDLVTLLLTFFVLLYTFSSIDAARFRGIAASLQMALTGQVSIFEDPPPGIDGPVDFNLPGKEEDPLEDIDPEEGVEVDILEREIKRIYGIVKDFVEKEGLDAEVRLRMDRRGVIIDIADNILFDSGKADIKPESRELLDKLTKLITSFENNIIVEGHTDNVPMSSSRYATNWDLSVHRATSVVHYFIQQKQIPPERLSAAGYGEYRPIAPNDTAENRALNRRVNILIEASLGGGEEDGAINQD